MPITLASGPVINTRKDGKALVLFKSPDIDLTNADVKGAIGRLIFVSEGRLVIASFTTRKLARFSDARTLAVRITVGDRVILNAANNLEKVDDATILLTTPSVDGILSVTIQIGGNDTPILPPVTAIDDEP